MHIILSSVALSMASVDSKFRTSPFHCWSDIFVLDPHYPSIRDLEHLTIRSQYVGTFIRPSQSHLPCKKPEKTNSMRSESSKIMFAALYDR